MDNKTNKYGMSKDELTPFIGKRIRHQGPHSVEYGILLRLTDRTADFRDERDEPDSCVTHTEIYRITPA